MKRSSFFAAAVIGASLGFVPSTATRAALITYTVDPSRSSLTLSGMFEGLPLELESFFPANSLVQSYSGTITAQRDLGANTLQITAGALAAMDIPGYPVNYTFTTTYPGPTPGGREFGGGIDNFSFAISSPTITSPSSFDVSQLSTAVASGEIHYSYYSLSGHSAPMAGTLTLHSANGTLTDALGLETLTIPVNFNCEVFLTEGIGTPTPLDLSFSGTIVAVSPEPASVATLGLPTLIMLARRQRRRARL